MDFFYLWNKKETMVEKDEWAGCEDTNYKKSVYLNLIKLLDINRALYRHHLIEKFRYLISIFA